MNSCSDHLIIDCDPGCDDAIAIRAGGRVGASGQAVVVDGCIGVRIEEVMSPAGGLREV